MRFLFLMEAALAFNIVGWFITDSGCGNKMNYTNFPYQYYTHLVISSPIVLNNGTAICDYTSIKEFVGKGSKIVWKDGIPNLQDIIFNTSFIHQRSNYLNTIYAAMTQCNITGLEFDYEPPLGILSPEEQIIYSQFLNDVKAAIKDKELSVDLGVWGISRGSFPLMVRPWINSTCKVDYINLMSYHWPLEVNINEWIDDVIVYTQLWKFNKSKINIGIPYYSFNITNEPLWCNLSDECPNLPFDANKCANITVISKSQNYEIAQFVKKHQLGGVFPWAANYDSLTNNNTLVSWLYS